MRNALRLSVCVGLAVGARGARAEPGPLTVRGLVQADATGYVGDLPPGATARDTFTLGFAGIQLDGHPDDYLHGVVLADLSQSRLTLLDAYAEARLASWLTLRVGKFPAPLTEERLTPKFMLPWISTSPAAYLLPVRELGVQALGTVGDGVLAYNAAVTNGSTAGSIGDNDPDSSKDLLGRVYAMPFRRSGVAAIAQLGVGVGASYGRRHGTATAPETLVLRSYGNAVFFAYRADIPTVATGTTTRVAPHVTWAWGPVAAFADYVHVVDHVGGTAVASDAVSATATIALTGEAATPFGRIRPRHALDRAGHVGGIQLVVGGGRVAVARAAFPALADPATAMRAATILGAGINWYPRAGLGVLIDGSRTSFAAAGGAAARPVETAIVARLELSL